MSNPTNQPKPGDKMPDSTVYAGISPDTEKLIYTAPADAEVTMTFNEAADYAKKLNQERYLGHDDWRVPTKAELNVLFNNRAAIGGFKTAAGSGHEDLYLSSERCPHQNSYAWAQYFNEGLQAIFGAETLQSSVRLVRTDASNEFQKGPGHDRA